MLTYTYKVSLFLIAISRVVVCLMCDVQIEGGFVQGVGLYTIEELQFSPEGVLMTRGPSQYKIPALCDVPPQLNVHLLPDSHNPHAIYSSKARQHNTPQHNSPFLFKGAFEKYTHLETQQHPCPPPHTHKLHIKFHC